MADSCWQVVDPRTTIRALFWNQADAVSFQQSLSTAGYGVVKAPTKVNRLAGTPVSGGRP